MTDALTLRAGSLWPRARHAQRDQQSATEYPMAGEESSPSANSSELQSEDLFNRLLPELKRLAHFHFQRERPGSTLQTTAIVNEAYLRLYETGYPSEPDFLRVASRVMRNILVDHYRRKFAGCRGGGAITVPLDEQRDGAVNNVEDLLLVDQLLGQLEKIDANLAKILEMKYILGATNQQIACALHLTEDQVRRQTTSAYAWMKKQLRSPQD